MSQAYSHLNQCQKQLEILLKAEPIIEAALGPKSTQYIRVERDITNAMLLCSKALGHNRIDVISQHYLYGL